MGILKIQNFFKTKRARLYTWLLRSDAGHIGKSSTVFPPFHSGDIKTLHIGDRVNIHAGGWIQTIPEYGQDKFDPELKIGDGTYIGHRCHIIVCDKMIIGKDVTIADNVYITDNLHGFEDISCGIMPQPLKIPGPVVIEDEVWLGERVCVMPNVTIGKHSVIGANSVVTKDIPPYSIAVGSPARVIKQYNHDIKKWEIYKEQIELINFKTAKLA
jgi:acetyltransferase-like isoleucine patch superfamily enzyme